MQQFPLTPFLAFALTSCCSTLRPCNLSGNHLTLQHSRDLVNGSPPHIYGGIPIVTRLATMDRKLTMMTWNRSCKHNLMALRICGRCGVQTIMLGYIVYIFDKFSWKKITSNLKNGILHRKLKFVLPIFRMFEWMKSPQESKVVLLQEPSPP